MRTAHGAGQLRTNDLVPPLGRSRQATIPWPSYPAVAAHPATRAFVEALAKRQRAAKTIDAYARNLEDLLRTWTGASPERVVEADAADVDSYLARLADDRGLSDATVRQRLGACLGCAESSLRLQC